MDISDALTVLINHFDSNGWPLHIKLDKLLSRYSLTSDDNRPGCDIVEIERHRPILGTSYVSGSGMNAFETYYMRYAVRASSLEVTELPERRGKIDIDIDDIVSSDLNHDKFSLTIEAIDEHNHLIKENVSGEKQTISNIDEAKHFCELFLDSFVDYFSDTLHRELTESHFDVEQIEQLLSAYEEEMKKSLLEKAENAWESREIFEE